jgi:hypothetical protein
MKSAPALLLFLPLLACAEPGLIGDATSADKSTSESKTPDPIAPDITIECASDDATWCETLAFDGSALIVDLQLPAPLAEVVIQKYLQSGTQEVIRRTLSCPPADPRG